MGIPQSQPSRKDADSVEEHKPSVAHQILFSDKQFPPLSNDSACKLSPKPQQWFSSDFPSTKTTTKSEFNTAKFSAVFSFCHRFALVETTVSYDFHRE